MSEELDSLIARSRAAIDHFRRLQVELGYASPREVEARRAETQRIRETARRLLTERARLMAGLPRTSPASTESPDADQDAH